MKILPINYQVQPNSNKNFKGSVKYVKNPLLQNLTYIDACTKNKLIEKLEKQLCTVLNRTNSKLTQHKFNPSTSLNTFVKVFIASPKEVYYSQRYGNEYCDYILDDYEPAYPLIEDIEKNYFGTNRHNYVKDFEQIRDYYYRYEMGMRDRYKPIELAYGTASAERKAVQEKQRLAQECINEYHRAGHLRFEKETLEDKENTEIFFTPNIEKRTPEYGEYDNFKATMVNLQWKYNDLNQKIASNEAQHSNKAETTKLKIELEKTLHKIVEMNAQKNGDCLKDSNARRARISEIKRELSPMFENLKRIYEELKNIEVKSSSY